MARLSISGERILTRTRSYELAIQDGTNVCIIRFIGPNAVDDSYVFDTFFKSLNSAGFSTFYIKAIGQFEYQVSCVQLFPVAVKVSSVVSEEFAGLFGLRTGSVMQDSLQEWVFCSEQLGAPTVSESHIKVFKLLSDEERRVIDAQSWKMFYFFTGYFAAKGYKLGAMTARFGKDDWGGLVLAEMPEVEVWGANTFQSVPKGTASLAAVLRGV